MTKCILALNRLYLKSCFCRIICFNDFNDRLIQQTIKAFISSFYSCKAAAIVAITTSGLTAKLCSKYRPHCPIVAVTRFDQVARQMQLHRGIIPVFYKEPRMENWMQDVEERIQHGVDLGKKSGFIKSGQPIVCITGWRQGAGSSNTVRILMAQ